MITLQCSQGGIPYNKEALDDKDREIERLKSQREELSRQLTDKCHELKSACTEYRNARDAILGWREADHPEWFCRRTAEWLADRFRGAGDKQREHLPFPVCRHGISLIHHVRCLKCDSAEQGQADE